jgi:hypothetical protein
MKWSEVNLRLTVSRPVCLGVGLPSGAHDQIFFFCFLADDCGFLDLWHPLWWEDGSVIYCTTDSRPCQSSHSWVEVPQNSRPYFTVSFETPPTWMARSLYLYPPGTGWPSYTPRHWVPFCRLLWLAGQRWRYSNPPPHGKACCGGRCVT